MCLGIPAKVVQIDDSQEGKVDYLGTKVKGIKQEYHNPNCFVDVHTMNDIKYVLRIMPKAIGRLRKISPK